MSFKEIYDVPKNHQLTIQLPQNFPSNQKVVVTVEEVPLSRKDKLKLMKKAATDPLYMQDLKEVNSDFDSINNEGL